MNLLKDRNITPELQFGFQKKHFVSEQAHHIVDIILNEMEKKKFGKAVFLDVQ